MVYKEQSASNYHVEKKNQDGSVFNEKNDSTLIGYFSAFRLDLVASICALESAIIISEMQ